MISNLFGFRSSSEICQSLQNAGFALLRPNHVPSARGKASLFAVRYRKAKCRPKGRHLHISRIVLGDSAFPIHQPITNWSVWPYRKNKASWIVPNPHSTSGSPARTRTADLVVNSHPLYRLSYRGISRQRIVPSAWGWVNFFLLLSYYFFRATFPHPES